MKYSAALAAASALGLDLPFEEEVTAAEADAERWVKGVCRYCGAGCGVYVGVRGGKVVAVKGDKENWLSLSQGKLPPGDHDGPTDDAPVAAR
jgi:nitrate reductase NapA